MTRSLISVAEARRRVLRAANRLGEELVPVQNALDRALAREVCAAGDVPPFACSAMDGYAVREGPAGALLTVVGESRAGRPSTTSVGDGQAIRISTGAAVPDGASAILRQEDVAQRDGGQVEATVAAIPGAHIRAAGEDMLHGAPVLAPGIMLGPAELGAAVAAGMSQLPVTRRPLVSILCTGDELRPPGEPLGPGEIHNSNATMLEALAERDGATVAANDRVGDDRQPTEVALRAAVSRSDLVIVSGGVSVGPHDQVKPVLADLGVAEQFWGVALQPGKPTWFGAHERTLVFGLPGNPVSAVVTFALFARAAIAAMLGTAAARAPYREAVLGTAVRLNPRREQALRVRLERRGGETVAIPNGAQGSHLVTSLLGADALAMIPPGEGELPPGSLVALEALPG